MRTAEYDANGTVTYSSQDEGVDRTCVDLLNDDSHYRFSCRCGCGAQFAGYGKDIKAAAKVGGNFKPVPILVPSSDVLTTTAGTGVVWVDAASREPGASDSPEEVVDFVETDMVELEEREETAEKPRPYVSDRYLKKAAFGLSDDEIDAYHREHPDELESRGVNLSERQPPAIGDLVYSISSAGETFSLIDYFYKTVGLEDRSIEVVFALLSNSKGKLVNLPLADLALHHPGRTLAKRGGYMVPLMLATLSAIAGSGIALGLFHYF